MMEGLKADARRDLERRRAFAERQRLAELGLLAATIAHDLRNPMNVVTMAVADCDPSVRHEVRIQLSRMERLVRDLLDYAKPWAVAPSEQDLAAALVNKSVTLDIPPV